MNDPLGFTPAREVAANESGEVDLIYKIEGKPSDVEVFELARVLDAFGNIFREGYKVTSGADAGEMVVRVKPFEPGSFIMDIALHVKQHPSLLFALSEYEQIEKIKELLECLGYIRKAKESGASLLQLILGLKNGRPEKVEKKEGDRYEYHASDGSVIPVNSPVHELYNNTTINNYTFNFAAPAQHQTVEGVLTFLKGAQDQTSVKIESGDVPALRAYSQNEVTAKPEILEETAIRYLNPKSGSYGQTTGSWTFTVAGRKGSIRAKITDGSFLAKYASGTIRFYQGDRLKVRLIERQVIGGDSTRMEYEIPEVLEYKQGHSTPKVAQLPSAS